MDLVFFYAQQINYFDDPHNIIWSYSLGYNPANRVNV